MSDSSNTPDSSNSPNPDSPQDESNPENPSISWGDSSSGIATNSSVQDELDPSVQNTQKDEPVRQDNQFVTKLMLDKTVDQLKSDFENRINEEQNKRKATTVTIGKKIRTFFKPAGDVLSTKCKLNREHFSFPYYLYERLEHVFRNGFWEAKTEDFLEEIKSAKKEFRSADETLLQTLLYFWQWSFVQMKDAMPSIESSKEEQQEDAASPEGEESSIIRKLGRHYSANQMEKMYYRHVELIETVLNFYRDRRKNERAQNPIPNLPENPPLNPPENPLIPPENPPLIPPENPPLIPPENPPLIPPENPPAE